MSTQGEEQRPSSYAHTLPASQSIYWEPLRKHLEEVAKLAEYFAGQFGAGDWGAMLGRWHDLGKYSADFQNYLLSTGDPDAGAAECHSGRVDHSTFGARYAAGVITKHKGQMLAYCIGGHHAGLSDGVSDEENRQRGTLQFRLDPARYSIPEVNCPDVRMKAPALKILPGREGLSGFQVSFFVRMIFSCLVDSDRLATEAFCNPESGKERAANRPSAADLKCQLDSFLEHKKSSADPTTVNCLRATVLDDCRKAAELPPGFFSLNVPTGGGKTYSSLAFALDHACRFDLRRVVVAIPFTSIIEQTADAFRHAMGPLAERGLIEHHTNIDPQRDTRCNQFGTENWDAPIIVTTNVQFFESLFASATSACRKLHRLARSVIVLDEAQTLPVELLAPSLAALNELVLNYGCSVVLCTATQPALERRSDFELGISNVRQIVEDPATLFQSVHRVEIHHAGVLSDEQLVQRLAAEASVLCIVNTRAHAARLFDRIIELSDPASCFHLSTWMCGKHRRSVLAAIRQRLKERAPCRVISTQLVEAGVDLDFPAVYRAPAGFDSIAQAAGRCNREGLLDLGHTYIFDSEELPPAGLLRDAVQAGRELIGKYSDPIAPSSIEAYFRLFYWSQKHKWDKYEVLPPLTPDLNSRFLAIQFRTAASKFKIIREEQAPILIPYDDVSRRMWAELNRGSVEFVPQRHLQPYLVSVHQQLLQELQSKGLVMEHDSGVWLLLNNAAYSDKKGLTPEAHGVDPALLMV